MVRVDCWSFFGEVLHPLTSTKSVNKRIRRIAEDRSTLNEAVGAVCVLGRAYRRKPYSESAGVAKHLQLTAYAIEALIGVNNLETFSSQ